MIKQNRETCQSRQPTALPITKPVVIPMGYTCSTKWKTQNAEALGSDAEYCGRYVLTFQGNILPTQNNIEKTGSPETSVYTKRRQNPITAVRTSNLTKQTFGMETSWTTATRNDKETG
jgi:hypothetical protein